MHRVVTRAGAPLHLTDIQYRLLILLASNPGRVLTQQQLLLQIWGGRAVENNQYLRIYMLHAPSATKDRAHPGPAAAHPYRNRRRLPLPALKLGG
ncbi:response regulator transcription factor KdpE [Azotobacter armeniacus]